MELALITHKTIQPLENDKYTEDQQIFLSYGLLPKKKATIYFLPRGQYDKFVEDGKINPAEQQQLAQQTLAANARVTNPLSNPRQLVPQQNLEVIMQCLL